MIIASSPAFRIGRPASFAVVVLSSLFLGGCLGRTVVTDLPKDEAREACVALDKGGVRCSLVEQTKLRGQDQDKWRVEIHGGDRTLAEALRLLQENDLPRHHQAGIEDVYPKDSSLFPTATEELIRANYAVSGELSRTFKTIPCVNDARVHVMIPDNSELHDSTEKPHAAASVLLISAANCPEPPKDQIAKFVANGVNGLDEKNIYVMSVQSPPSQRVQLDDLQQAMSPSPGLVLDYAYSGGGTLLTLFALVAAFRFAPGIIRWLRTQTELLRESLVG